MNASSPVATAAIATLIAGAGVGAQQAPRFVERVDVARVIVDARVLDDRGNPVGIEVARADRVARDHERG